MKPVKYISKTEYSWRVKIAINQKQYFEYFCFNAYGGRKKAMIAAKIWRDAFLEMHGMIDRLDYIKSPDFYTSLDKAIIGVFKSHTTTSVNWTARYAINGTEYKKHFSVNKYGERKAFQMACKIRHEQCGKLRLINRKLIPCLPKVPYKKA